MSCGSNGLSNSTGVDDDGDSGGSTFIWGIVFGLLGSIAINTGNNLQSLGIRQLEEKSQAQSKMSSLDGGKGEDEQTKEDEAPAVEEINGCDSQIWVLGTTIFLTGSLLNFASYGLAAQSVLACLEAIQFVTNLAFGKFMLQKRITKRMYIGTAMIVAGTVMAVLFGSKCEYKGTASSLISLYENPAYITYLVLIFVGGIAIQMLHLHHQKLLNEGRPTRNTPIILPVTYAVFSALFGTQSVVQAKCLAELLEAMQNEGEPIFEHWFTYMSLFIWIAFVSVWLYRLNEALGKYDPLFIIPLLQANFIFFAIVSGGIYFKEFNVFTPVMWAGFVIGVIIIFYGLFLLRPEEVIVPMEDYVDVEQQPPCHAPSPEVGKQPPLQSPGAVPISSPDSAMSLPGGGSNNHTPQSKSSPASLATDANTTPGGEENRVSPPPFNHRRSGGGSSFVVKVTSVAQQSMATTYNTPHRPRSTDYAQLTPRSRSPGSPRQLPPINHGGRTPAKNPVSEKPPSSSPSNGTAEKPAGNGNGSTSAESE